MTDKIYDIDYLEVGDAFEGGPIEQSYFISAVFAAGGTVEIHGNKATITSLPEKESKKEAPKPKAEVTPKAEKEDLSPAEDLAPAEEAVKEEASKAKTGPKAKAPEATDSKNEG